MAARQAVKQKKKSVNNQDQRDYFRDPRVAIDEHGNIVYASQAFCQIAGIELYQAVGSKASRLITIVDENPAGSDPDLWLRTIKTGSCPVKIGAGGAPQVFHFEWLSVPDGRKYLIGSTEQQNYNKSDRFIKLISGSEAAAQNIEEELRHFTNLSHDAMAIINVAGNFIQANTTFRELFGFDDQQLRHLTFPEMVLAEDRHAVRNSLRSLSLSEGAEKNPVIDFEARMLDRDAQTLWMDWRLKRIGASVYCVGRDLTAIKSHEAKLKRREQQLSEAESIGRMGHWHWRIGDENISFSDEIYRIFGVDKDTFRPTLDNLGERVHKRDIGRLLQAFQRAILERNDYDIEFRALRPDGEVRYVRCQGRCDRDEEEEVVGLFGIMQDITERTIYEIDLREAKEAAERAYAAKSQFLANMSHELRTPLNAIIGFSEMMQRQLLGPIGTEKYLEYIDGIRESGEHLLDLISDILNMSKIEAGKYELDLEEFNLAEVIRTAMHMIQSRAHDAGLDITTRFDREDQRIIADRRAVMQIVLNLLSNSVKFTDTGGSVRLECFSRDNYISIKVADTGIGIPANKLKSITRPFEQAASHYTREHEGSGLGLAITKELAEMHGGSIHIDSAVGVGTTVTIRLPYDASQYYPPNKNRQP